MGRGDTKRSYLDDILGTNGERIVPVGSVLHGRIGHHHPSADTDLKPCTFRLGQMQLRLVGAWINLCKQIAGANVLPLLESDSLHFAIDPDVDRHGV